MKCKWVNGKLRLPDSGKSIIYQYRPEGIDACSWELRRGNRQDIYFLSKPDQKYDVIWLDESPLEALDSQPSFSLQQALDIWDACEEYKEGKAMSGFKGAEDMQIPPDKKQYFLEHFKIELP